MGESGRGESPDRNPRAFVREFLSKGFNGDVDVPPGAFYSLVFWLV